jgi:hypothetical protein
VKGKKGRKGKKRKNEKKEGKEKREERGENFVGPGVKSLITFHLPNSRYGQVS